MIKETLKKNSFIKKTVTYLLKTKSNIHWKRQKGILIEREKPSLKMENLINDINRIIIVVPHADDELIGSYHLINKYKRNVMLFYCGFTGNNPSQENKKIRQFEFEKFCKNEKIDYYISSSDVENELFQVVKKFSPSIILLPTCIDWQWEHRKCNYICLNVLNKLKIIPKIGWYQVSVPISNSYLNFTVSFSKKQQKDKWKKFSNVYRSQRNLPVFRFQMAERITGYKINKYAAEAFSIMSKEKWSILLEFLDSDSTVKILNDMQNNINNLIKIWDDVSKIFKNLDDRVDRGIENGR